MALARFFAVVGVVATVVGLLQVLFEASASKVLPTYGYMILAATIVVAAIAAGWRVLQPSQVEFTAAGTNLRIEVRRGELFSQPGNIVVPVNDLFDTELGKPVDPGSVHGQFLKHRFAGNAADARKAISVLLKSADSSQVEGMPAATKRYAIGETCAVAGENRHFILVALSRVDPATRQTSVSPDEYVRALFCLWKAVRECCNNQAVSVPLMGNGASRVKFKPPELADLIVMTAIHAYQSSPFASRLTLTLMPDDWAKIDLHQIKRRYG